jgi:hypothetical protein
VVAPETAAAMGVRSVLVVNPAYRDEIVRDCAAQGLPFDITAVE